MASSGPGSRRELDPKGILARTCVVSCREIVRVCPESVASAELATPDRPIPKQRPRPKAQSQRPGAAVASGGGRVRAYDATDAGSERIDLPAPAGRLVSLDAFRGATIALMVLVNTAGDGHHVYAPLRHAEWHGWTPTDVVFPSFMWIAGLSMTLSFAKRLSAGASRGQLFRQTLQALADSLRARAAAVRIPDLRPVHDPIDGRAAAVRDLRAGGRGDLSHDRRARTSLWLVGLLGSYWALMMLVPVPGFGAGHLDLEGNLAHYVDRVVLGAHNYEWTKTWDPEGIVSTIPAIATWVFGLLAGDLIALRVRSAIACS